MNTPQMTVLCTLTAACLLNSAFAETRRVQVASVSAESAAEREDARRQQMVTRAKGVIKDGDKAMKEKDYEQAVNLYQTAADSLQDSPRTHGLHEDAVDKFCDASVKLALQRIDEGRWADAKRRLETVLDEKYTGKQGDPFRNRIGQPAHSARVLLAKLEDPQYYNQTITPKFRERIDNVKQLMLDAQGFYDTGRYDLAFKRCEEILGNDPYNIAARKMQEKINLQRDNSAISGYNEGRSRALWMVQKGWEYQPRRYGANKVVVMEQQPTEKVGTASITKKLNEIIIPTVKFDNVTIREAIDFLKRKSIDLDPEKKGVNIVLQLDAGPGAPAVAVPDAAAPPAPGIPGIPGVPDAAPALPGAAPGGAVSAETRITLSLAQIPLIEALKYVTSLSNLKYKIEPFAVSVVPSYVSVDVLVTKEYKVPPGFISASPIGGNNALAAPAGPVAAAGPPGGPALAGRASARDYLEGRGVTFPPGSSAIFIPTSSRLVVRNTQVNLDLVDAIVDASWQALPSQVDIEAKFVEINQNNLKELSFDWLLGQFNLPHTKKVFGGGGTSGNQTVGGALDFPFTPPGSTTPVGAFPLSPGNRNGSVAITANAVDALLAGTGLGAASKIAPAIFSVAGIFTDPQFQLAIRALNQKKGIDLLSAPRVTTKSGQKAVIEVVREFRYPTEFQPPQIPTNVGSGGGVTTALPGQSVTPPSIPITPTTPTAFETRKVGVTLEVEPVVGADGQTIDLNLQPEVVEFEGFINYGSPILAPPTQSTNPLTGLLTTNTRDQRVLTDNIINQPIFSTRKVQTNVTLWDGQTVVIGGLIREDVQKVEDKTPLLGDLPFIGRLFRSSSDQHLKKNLMIFLTARLVNPAGDPVHSTEEEEEMAEVLAPPPAPLPPIMPAAPGFAK